MEKIDVQVLKSMYLAPYIDLATVLCGKSRHAGGNMFRHQMDTLGILIDYGYIDSVLLKASIMHDVLEDVPDFNVNQLLQIDSESSQVYELVLEVTRPKGQSKPEYLKNVLKNGSTRAKILKCADRISNVISLGFVNDPRFIERYCEETELYVFPIALDVNFEMYDELLHLVMSRRQYLKEFQYIHEHYGTPERTGT
ncbi:MAG: hypothetical protein ACTTH7_06060 [Treponema sp.]